MISFGGSIISLLLLCREGDFGRMDWEGIWGGMRGVLYESSDISDASERRCNLALCSMLKVKTCLVLCITPLGMAVHGRQVLG